VKKVVVVVIFCSVNLVSVSRPVGVVWCSARTVPITKNGGFAPFRKKIIRN